MSRLGFYGDAPPEFDFTIALPETPVVRAASGASGASRGFYGACPCGTIMRVVPTPSWASRSLLKHVMWRHAPRTWLYTNKVARMVAD